MPMPSRWSSVAGVVMLFHSLMSRMKKTRPDVLEGEIEPKTASWRSHHGAMTRTNSPTQAMAAATGMAGRGLAAASSARLRRDARRARHRSQIQARPSATRTSRPSFRDNVASPASKPASANERGDPLSPRAPIQSDATTSGWNSEKLSGWTM